jgi:hypothetical protein
VVVVKKSKSARLRHPLAGIFRTYNLFEFKNPDDRLDPNDYDKGMAIARLYKVIEHGKMLTLDEITMTFVSTRHPRAMFDMIRTRGLALHRGNPLPGIYRVEGEAIPVQVIVMKELLGPEEVYMFAPFLTGREKLRVDATLLLLRKHLDDPANPYRRELLEFKFRNQLVIPEEMEVVMEMLKQITEKDRARIEEILQNHPSGIAMAERFAAKAAAKAAAEAATEAATRATTEVKLETARAALKKGFSIDDVAEITGLPNETVLELKKELEN